MKKYIRRLAGFLREHEGRIIMTATVIVAIVMSLGVLQMWRVAIWPGSRTAGEARLGEEAQFGAGTEDETRSRNEDWTSGGAQPGSEAWAREGARPGNGARQSLEDYFVSTNDFYTEKYGGSLAEMAANLHYYDFDAMAADYYGSFGAATCMPVEAPSGTVVYDYGFRTGAWQVELCTMIEDANDSIVTWIILYNPEDEAHAIESKPVAVPYKIGNVVTNYHPGAEGSGLFQCERKTFADLLALIGAGALDAKDGVVPFAKVGLDYTIINPPLQDPAE